MEPDEGLLNKIRREVGVAGESIEQTSKATVIPVEERLEACLERVHVCWLARYGRFRHVYRQCPPVGACDALSVIAQGANMSTRL